MAKVKDYYKILGLSKNASKDDIKKAYRELARKYHPDLNSGDKKAEEKFKEIQEAHEVLSDDQKRKQYDMFGSAGMNYGGAGRGGQGRSGQYQYSGDFSQFEDIFKDVFGFGGQRGSQRQTSDPFSDLFGFKNAGSASRKQPTQNIEHEIVVDFLTSINGGQRDLTINTHDARGKKSAEKISVKIPPGVDNGSKIRVQGMGETNRGKRGDLILKVKVSPHPIFSRQKNDIYLELPITFYEAVLGAEVEVPTVDGKANLKIPAGIQNGAKLRLKGKGVKSLRSKTRGNQYVIVKISLPEEVSDNIKEFSEKIKNETPYNPRKDLEKYF